VRWYCEPVSNPKTNFYLAKSPDRMSPRIVDRIADLSQRQLQQTYVARNIRRELINLKSLNHLLHIRKI
jgi:hypothetical protein